MTLHDGRAFTAAHCLAAVDGARGVVIGVGDTCWRVVKRWSPARRDVAWLQALTPARAGQADDRGAASDSPVGPAPHLATRSLVRTGRQVQFVGHTGRRFQARTATVIAVTPTSATAVVDHRSGVCANDSGGPVFMAGVLVGIVTHRTGPPLSARCSCHLVFTRLDSPEMRRRLVVPSSRGGRGRGPNSAGRALV